MLAWVLFWAPGLSHKRNLVCSEFCMGEGELVEGSKAGVIAGRLLSPRVRVQGGALDSPA